MRRERIDNVKRKPSVLFAPPTVAGLVFVVVLGILLMGGINWVTGSSPLHGAEVGVLLAFMTWGGGALDYWLQRRRLAHSSMPVVGERSAKFPAADDNS